MKKSNLRFAVFASGKGSNLQAIMQAVKKEEITAELALVFSNNHKAFALERAKKAKIPTLVLSPKDYTNKQSFERDLVIHLKENKIDFIVLAGYMVLFTPYFIKQFPDKIINIHPSLLPAFKGKQGIKDAFTYGCKVAGVTVHFVNDKMDAGPIINQEAFKVKEGESLESLEERIHKIEHKIYPKAIEWYAQGRLKITGRKVKVLDKPA